MRLTARKPLALALVLLTVGAITGPAHVTAEEPTDEFLTALRERRLFDTAIDYLTEMETSNLSTPQFKQIIAFEKGATLIDASQYIRDTNLKKKKLDEAQALLDSFIAANPNHQLVAIAKNKLANLLIQRADVNILNSKKSGLSSAQQEALLVEARGQYEEAFQVFQKTREDLNARLQRITNVTDPKLEEIRDKYRAEYLQTLLLMPAVKEQKADTYPEESEERKTTLQEASAEYQEVYEKYRNWQAAIYARIYQGRCQVKLKNYKEALSFLQDILDQDNSPDFRPFKKMALLLAVECWMNDDKEYYFETIQQLEPVLATVAQNETDPDWLRLKVALAKAYRSASEAINARETKSADDRRQVLTYRNLGVGMIREVAKINGPLKSEAQQLLVDWGATGATADPSRAEPTNFAEARQRGRELLDEYETARLAVGTLEQRAEQSDDVEERVNLKNQLEAARATLETAPDASLGYLRMAIEFAEAAEEVVIDDITSTQYFVAYVYFMQGKHEHVGVLGEYLMRMAPQAAGSRETCDLALNSYWRMYAAAPPDDRQFEVERLKALGEGVMVQWPGEGEAVKAATLMAWVLLQSGDVAGAEEYLAKIPTDSPQRYETELAIGQALWGEYLSGAKEFKMMELNGAPQGVNLAAEKTKLEAVRGQALTYLEAGSKQLAADTIDRAKAIASLSLAQAYVETDQVDKAITHLEGANVGLLKLLETGNRAVQDPWIVVNTYKTAVRAYIGALNNTSNKQQMVDNALSMMSRLKESMGDDETAKAQLIGIYVGLANDLKKQMDSLPTAQEKQAFAQGLIAFLDEVRQDASELDTLVWVANTLAKVGQSFKEAGLEDDAKGLFEAAGRTYVTILNKGETDTEWLPENVALEVKRQLAVNRSNQGNYSDAIESFKSVLKVKPSLVDVQMEAATAYQMWAEATSSSDHYLNAMRGDEDKIIWGWGNLANKIAKYPDYRDKFFEARLHLAECRFGYAKIEDSDRFLAQAIKDISQTYRLLPDLGGPAMKARYDRVLREIQKERGESNPKGLAAFEVPTGN